MDRPPAGYIKCRCPEYRKSFRNIKLGKEWHNNQMISVVFYPVSLKILSIHQTQGKIRVVKWHMDIYRIRFFFNLMNEQPFGPIHYIDDHFAGTDFCFEIKND